MLKAYLGTKEKREEWKVMRIKGRELKGEVKVSVFFFEC
jgi:hypothetical protein